MTDSVTVEQCDREAAAQSMPGNTMAELDRCLDVKRGMRDSHAWVQAFARHRTASEQRGYDRAIAEVVAWLRKNAAHVGPHTSSGASYVHAATAIEAGEHKP